MCLHLIEFELIVLELIVFELIVVILSCVELCVVLVFSAPAAGSVVMAARNTTFTKPEKTNRIVIRGYAGW